MHVSSGKCEFLSNRPTLMIVGLLFAWYLGFMVPALAAADPALRIVDSAESGNLGSFETDMNEFTRTLKIESTTTAEATAVTVKGAVTLDSSGGQSKIWLDGGGTEVDLGAIPAQASRPLTVRTSLPVPGSYRFSLTIRHTGGPPQVYGLAVKRFAPSVELVEAQGTALSLEADSEDYETQLVLSTTTKVPAEGVTVSVPVFTRPGGSPVEVRINGADNSADLGRIEGFGTLPFRVGASLPEAGKYSGRLDVTYEGGRKTYSITVEKKVLTATLSATVAAAGATMTGGAKPSLHATLRETGGRTVRVEKPAMEGLTRTIGKSAAVAAQYQDVMFFASNGKPIETWPVVLPPNASYDLRLDVGGIAEPGHFAGKLLIPAVDRGAVDVAITFDVQRHWYFAVLALAAGVLVSLVMRLWATRLRPRMRGLQGVLRVLKQLQVRRACVIDLRPEEREIFDGLREQLALVYEDLRIGTTDSAEPVLSIVRPKLELVLGWVDLNRQLSGLEPAPIFRPLREELNGVREYLMNPRPAGNDHASAVATMKALPDKIKEAMGDVLSKFLEELNDLGSQLGDATLKRDWQDRVVDKVEATKLELAQGAFGNASEKIGQARLGAAQLLAEALRSSLSDTPPGWMTADRFGHIRDQLDEVVSSTSGEAAVTAYRKALTLYLESYSRDVAVRLGALIDDLNKSGQGDSAKITALRQGQSKVDSVQSLLREGKLGEAAIACREAEKTYADCLRVLEPSALSPYFAKTVMPAAAGATMTAGIGDVPEFAVPAPSFPTSLEDTEGALSRLQTTMGVFDWLYHAIVALVAVLLGVYVLWAGNPTWGSAPDILIAVLWGLGLHALTTGPTAYKGLADLAGKFGS